MVQLNALKRAPIMNEVPAPLSAIKYTAASSNPAVVEVLAVSGSLYAVGRSAGTATLSATRLIDGAVATLDIEVIAAAPFTISLGAESAA